jgi:hypothetical protein
VRPDRFELPTFWFVARQDCGEECQRIDSAWSLLHLVNPHTRFEARFDGVFDGVTPRKKTSLSGTRKQKSTLMPR